MVLIFTAFLHNVMQRPTVGTSEPPLTSNICHKIIVQRYFGGKYTLLVLLILIEIEFPTSIYYK